MAKKRAGPAVAHITDDRAGRLFRLLKVLATAPQPRGQLVKRLKVGMRTFYRDVDLLRQRGIRIEPHQDGYVLLGGLDAALERVPFPDPELSFGEVMQLMRGRGKAHARLKAAFGRVTG